MWDEQKRSRYRNLLECKQSRPLSDEEQTEFASLVSELERIEGGYLGAATDRIRQQRKSLENQNRILEQVAHRKQALVNRYRKFLSDMEAEREAIEGELAEALAGNPSSTPFE